jgi:membrane protease YdiL (CAAX protease family)
MLSVRGAYAFCVLACAITWLLDLPVVLALLAHEQPATQAMLLGGLGAFGPTLAALAIAGPRGELREVFGRWRTSFRFVVLGLLTLPALHLVATALEVALGGTPAHWFYPPVRPEHVVALVFFSVGEEFGWRGFAYPRLCERHGPLLACVVLGTVWAFWHLGMWFTAEGPPSASVMGLRVVEFVLGSLIFAFVFEQSGRSMAVAIALHAGAHLDNIHRAPEGELRLWVLRHAVHAIAALFAALALWRRFRGHHGHGPVAKYERSPT